MTNPHDPYGAPGGQQPGVPAGQAPPPYGDQTSPQQGWGHQQQGYQGYVAPGKSPDLPKLVTVAAWVVLGLHGLFFLYRLTQSGEYDGDFADNLFGGMPVLASGLFYAAIMLAVGVWLKDRQEMG
jgi:hypothetical protein